MEKPRNHRISTGPQLQPGRNYPTAALAFGANHSANMDVGDVDRDSDLDVFVANFSGTNRLYQSGLAQGTR